MLSSSVSSHLGLFVCRPSVQWWLWRAVKHWAAQPRLWPPPRPLCPLISFPTEITSDSLSSLTHSWTIPPLSSSYRTLPSCARTPPHRLSFPCPSLSLSRSTSPPPHTSSGPEIRLQLLDSHLCTATLSSRPLPAARLLIGIGGEERIAVRHGRPLEPAEPGQGHSHHSCATAAHSKQEERERARDAGVKGKRDKTATEQPN